MTPRWQIKSLSVTSDPITAGISQEADVLLDNQYINNICTYWHVFLDYIWSRRKPVQRLENVGVTLDSHLDDRSDNFHYNNKNNQLKKQV